MEELRRRSPDKGKTETEDAGGFTPQNDAGSSFRGCRHYEPTHFAVAIKYDNTVFDAPYVVAKGEDFLAARIKERAAEAGVEIVENKPLARMLYYNVDLGSPIPPELYQTVAEILAVIYNARQAG